MRSADGGQPGRKTSTLTTRCTGRAIGSRAGTTSSGMPRIERHVLDVGALEQRPDADRVAHPGHVGGDRAVAERDQRLRPLSDEPDLVEVVLATRPPPRRGRSRRRPGTPSRRRAGCRRCRRARRSRAGARPCRGTTCGSPSSRRARPWRAAACVIAGSASWPMHLEVRQERPALLAPLGDGAALLEERAGRADLDALAAARAGRRFAPRRAHVGHDPLVDARAHDAPRVGALDLAADPDAADAHDAAVVIDREERVDWRRCRPRG